jgi:hypothetical protein
MSTQLDDEGAAPSRRIYERPVLSAVGNLYDLLAGGGTQNADPGGGSNPPQCVSGGIFLDVTDC